LHADRRKTKKLTAIFAILASIDVKLKTCRSERVKGLK
jgi:hypothetical protein